MRATSDSVTIHLPDNSAFCPGPCARQHSALPETLLRQSKKGSDRQTDRDRERVRERERQKHRHADNLVPSPPPLPIPPPTTTHTTTRQNTRTRQDVGQAGRQATKQTDKQAHKQTDPLIPVVLQSLSRLRSQTGGRELALRTDTMSPAVCHELHLVTSIQVSITGSCVSRSCNEGSL